MAMHKWFIEIYPQGQIIDGEIVYILSKTTSDELIDTYIRSWCGDKIESLIIVMTADTRDEAIAKGIALMLKEEMEE